MSRTVRMLVEVDIEVHDDEWSNQDLLDNTPDYFVSMIKEGEARERRVFAGRDDGPAYNVVTDDLTVWVTDDYFRDIEELRKLPLREFWVMEELAKLSASQRHDFLLYVLRTKGT